MWRSDALRLDRNPRVGPARWRAMGWLILCCVAIAIPGFWYVLPGVGQIALAAFWLWFDGDAFARGRALVLHVDSRTARGSAQPVALAPERVELEDDAG
jgi:hypothetical protein